MQNVAFGQTFYWNSAVGRIKMRSLWWTKKIQELEAEIKKISGNEKISTTVLAKATTSKDCRPTSSVMMTLKYSQSI